MCFFTIKSLSYYLAFNPHPTKLWRSISETRKDKAIKILPVDCSGRDLFKINILKLIFILVSESRIFKVGNEGWA